MAFERKRAKLAVLAAAVLIIFGLALSVAAQEDREAELARVTAMAEEMLPQVAEIIGLEAGDMVTIGITNKTEVREFLVKLLEEEFPGDEMERMSRCLKAFGLLPEDYDLRQGFTDILHEQAGAFYDPRTKTYWSIIDLPAEFKIPMMEKTIVAHELAHALQDRAIDLLSMEKADRDDSDAGFAHASVMEGMASVAMLCAIQGMQQDKLPDLGKMMRMSMSMMKSNPLMQVFSAAPRYMQESLIGPYADGASFVQAFLKENPGSKSGELLGALPESSEQILHYEKYKSDDKPTAIEFSGLAAALPEGWTPFYSNTLGEFDIKIMFELAGLEKEAPELAAGWDGIRYASFTNEGELLIAGTSVWDSEADALEFAGGLRKVLDTQHGEERVAVRRSGNRVSFLLGIVDEETKGGLLKALENAPARER
jgi:hypothetical protein